MGKIIAIGGGHIGETLGEKKYPITTKKIDDEIIRLSGKKNPKLLFIPTASSDSQGYVDIIRMHFGKRLRCKVDVLYLIKEKHSYEQIRKKTLSSDIIYVGGGNTLKMMNIWRKFGVDKILVEAWKKGIVLSGISAGSICWFKSGNSDSRKFTSGSNRLIRVTGLGLIDALHCPHYDSEIHRQKDLKRMMKTTSKIVAFALENDVAIEIIDDKYRIITSQKGKNAFKIYWKNNKYNKTTISKNNMFRPLKELLSK